jgi:hypothetical protein
MSTELIAKIDEILKEVEIPDRSTFFQLKNFVLGKEPTIHGQIWACIRNIDDRRDQIESLGLEIENSEDDVRLLNISITRMQNEKNLDISGWEEEKEIRIRKVNRQKTSLITNIEKLKKKVKYILEELQYLTSAYDALVEVAGGVKKLDDPEVQRNYWNEKLTEELNLTFLLKKPVSSELVHTILALDDDMPIKKQMVQILHQVQTQMIAERDKQKAEKSQVAKVEVTKG